MMKMTMMSNMHRTQQPKEPNIAGIKGNNLLVTFSVANSYRKQNFKTYYTSCCFYVGIKWEIINLIKCQHILQ